ncbi:MAG TPA: S41 family peptidase [Bacteroidia bacterium]|nr:S41 family peptidase [Bacteroidia bacterium]
MESENKRSLYKYLPLILAVVLAAGIFIGSRMNVSFVPSRTFFSSKANQSNKLSDVLNYIQNEYVDTVNQKNLVDISIEQMLQNLDPHSAYIPEENLQAANEPLEGNFEGIGVEFHIQQDTIMVVTTISGGPSDMVGIQPGDRIVKVDGKNVAGIGITNNDVFQKLRGPGGTKVKISVLRRTQPGLIDFNITRGKIPIYSVDVFYMVDAKTGYMKVNRFAATTFEPEFMNALSKLKKQGMTQLILDLRGNPGGYLDAATKLADEFLPDKKLIVYTQGKSRPKTVYEATKEGNFETGKVVVMIDQGSASAAEILAGALQDWDRATIVGRRSFGKGLVQEQTIFPDGSALRLTIARYYTPTGRSIQKSYKGGYEEYQHEVDERFKNGEFENADSIKEADTVKYTTPGGKIVYGGGGIKPDVFVPLDTSENSDYGNDLFRSNLISQFAYDYVDKNRSSLKQYKDFKSYHDQFQISDQLFDEFILYAEKQGVKKNEAGIKKSGKQIKLQLKAFIARQVFGNNGFFPVINEADNTFIKALEIINQ